MSTSMNSMKNMQEGFGKGAAVLAGISATTLQYVMLAIGVGLLVIWALFLSGKDEYIGIMPSGDDAVATTDTRDVPALEQEKADNISKYNFWISVILAMGVALVSASVASKYVCSNGAAGVGAAKTYFGMCALVGLVGAIAAFSANSVPFVELAVVPEETNDAGEVTTERREAGGTSAPTFLVLTGVMSVVCCLVGIAGVVAAAPAAPAGKANSPGFGFDFEF